VQCKNAAGDTGQVATAVVTINAPMASIFADPTTVPQNGTTTLSWNTANVNRCDITKETEQYGVQSFLSNVALPSGTAVSSPLASTTVFAIDCDNGAAIASTVVNVLPGFGEF